MTRNLVRGLGDAPADLVEAAEALPLLLHGTYAMVDRETWLANRQAAEVAAVVAHEVGGQGLVLERSDINLPDLTPGDTDRVMLCLSNFISNVSQEVQRLNVDDITEAHLAIRVRAVVDGDYLHVVVHDAFPPIPQRSWLSPGTSLERLHQRLARLDGGLSQESTPEGKCVIARWMRERPV